MRIDAQAANAALLLANIGKAAQPSALLLQQDAAKPAGPVSILPPAQTQSLSFETVLALQGAYEEPQPVIEAPSAEELFLEEARKSPIERMREQILEQLGLSEADLADMPPDERRAVEDQIRELIEEKFRQASGAGEAPADTNAEMLRALL